MDERIGIFGGTFNPVHTGHIQVAQSFLNSGYIQRLWVLPAADPPHKPGKKLESFHHRSEMLRIAFRNQASVEIVELELKLPNPSYTLQTFQHLKSQFPGKTFYLCMGSDSLASFTNWYRYKDLLNLTDLLVAERPGCDYSEIPKAILDKVHVVEHEPVKVSSSQIRQKKTNTDQPKEHSLLTAEVAEYIRNNNLYQ